MIDDRSIQEVAERISKEGQVMRRRGLFRFPMPRAIYDSWINLLNSPKHPWYGPQVDKIFDDYLKEQAARRSKWANP